jgi:hypothetical protein
MDVLYGHGFKLENPSNFEQWAKAATQLDLERQWFFFFRLERQLGGCQICQSKSRACWFVSWSRRVNSATSPHLSFLAVSEHRLLRFCSLLAKDRARYRTVKKRTEQPRCTVCTVFTAQRKTAADLLRRRPAGPNGRTHR